MIDVELLLISGYTFEKMPFTASFLPLTSPQVVHMVWKWRYGTGLWSSGTVLRDIGDRRQSVSRQPSFTLSEWTDAQEDLLDMDPVPQTPVFEMGSDTKTEGDAATLTVTPVGLQERLEGVQRAAGWGETWV